MAAAHSSEKDWGNRRREAFVGFVREVLEPNSYGAK